MGFKECSRWIWWWWINGAERDYFSKRYIAASIVSKIACSVKCDQKGRISYTVIIHCLQAFGLCDHCWLITRVNVKHEFESLLLHHWRQARQVCIDGYCILTFDWALVISGDRAPLHLISFGVYRDLHFWRYRRYRFDLVAPRRLVRAVRRIEDLGRRKSDATTLSSHIVETIFWERVWSFCCVFYVLKLIANWLAY